MEKAEFTKYFVNTIILLAKSQILIRDSFFSAKITEKIYSLTANFMTFSEEEILNSIARYQIVVEKLISSIDSANDLLGELRYLHTIDDDLLLLKSERSLLILKLSILKKKFEFLSTNTDEIKNKIEHKTADYNVYKSDNKSKSREAKRLTPNKKKILDFIKAHPNSRTKDIIYEFSVLSDRTVKRNLTDLLRTNLVGKRIDNKAVYYYFNEAL